MSAKWPNTGHWQRLVSTFRALDGSAWRTAAAVAMGVEKSDLRARFDRGMNAVEVGVFDGQLMAAVRARVDQMAQSAFKLETLYADLAAQHDRRMQRWVEAELDVTHRDIFALCPVVAAAIGPAIDAWDAAETNKMMTS